MGWSSGSGAAIDMWNAIREFIAPDKRKLAAKVVYKVFTDMDADDWDGTSQLEIDADVNQED